MSLEAVAKSNKIEQLLIKEFQDKEVVGILQQLKESGLHEAVTYQDLDQLITALQTIQNGLGESKRWVALIGGAIVHQFNMFGNIRSRLKSGSLSQQVAKLGNYHPTVEALDSQKNTADQAIVANVSGAVFAAGLLFTTGPIGFIAALGAKGVSEIININRTFANSKWASEAKEQAGKTIEQLKTLKASKLLAQWPDIPLLVSLNSIAQLNSRWEKSQQCLSTLPARVGKAWLAEIPSDVDIPKHIKFNNNNPIIVNRNNLDIEKEEVKQIVESKLSKVTTNSKITFFNRILGRNAPRIPSYVAVATHVTIDNVSLAKLTTEILALQTETPLIDAEVLIVKQENKAKLINQLFEEHIYVGFSNKSPVHAVKYAQKLCLETDKIAYKPMAEPFNGWTFCVPVEISFKDLPYFIQFHALDGNNWRDEKAMYFVNEDIASELLSMRINRKYHELARKKDIEEVYCLSDELKDGIIELSLQNSEIKKKLDSISEQLTRLAERKNSSTTDLIRGITLGMIGFYFTQYLSLANEFTFEVDKLVEFLHAHGLQLSAKEFKNLSIADKQLVELIKNSFQMVFYPTLIPTKVAGSLLSDTQNAWGVT